MPKAFTTVSRSLRMTSYIFIIFLFNLGCSTFGLQHIIASCHLSLFCRFYLSSCRYWIKRYSPPPCHYLYESLPPSCQDSCLPSLIHPSIRMRNTLRSTSLTSSRPNSSQQGMPSPPTPLVKCSTSWSIIIICSPPGPDPSTLPYALFR